MSSDNNSIRNEKITADKLREIHNNLSKNIAVTRVDIILNKVEAAVKLGATEYTLYTIAVPPWDNRSEEEILDDYVGHEEVLEFRDRKFNFKIEKKASNNIVNDKDDSETNFYKIILTW